jgi:RND family efflux transporter MFP subunit
MNKYIKITLSVAVIAALGAAGVKAVKKAKTADAAQPAATIYPIVAKQMQPQKGHVTLSLPYLAVVGNDKDVTLSSRIAARILSIKKSGTPVKKGELVVQLDTTEIKSNLQSVQSQLKAAQLSLENLKATHQRTLDLLKVQGASVEQSERELSNIAGLEAKIAGLREKEVQLRNNLSYAAITAPTDGVIAKSMGSEGGMGMPGKPLVQLHSNEDFYLLLRLPDSVPVKGVRFNGKIYKKPIALASTFNGLKEYKVYVDAQNLTAGERSEVDVITYDDEGTALPFDALLNRSGKSYVLTVNGERTGAKPREVRLLQSAEQGVVVADDLTGTSIVIAKPDILLKLTGGYALKIKE